MNQIFPYKWVKLFNPERLAFPVFFMALINISIGQEVYDLNRCINTGLERNFSLKIVRNQEEITTNNFTRGNAGMLPSVATSNRIGGSIQNIDQNMSNGDEVVSEGVQNTSGQAGVDLGMTIFNGFEVKHTYRKLGVLNEIGGLNTQMAIENLIAQIVAEYYFYIEQLTLYNNLAYAVLLSRERVRIDEQRYLLGGASKLELLQSLVYLNADSSRYARQTEVLRSSQIRLNELMASEDPGENIALKDTIIHIEDALIFDVLWSQTQQYNTSLQIASKNQYLSELDYKIIKARSYPYLNMSAGYGYNYNSYGTGSVKSQQSIGGDYGLTLGMDIYDGSNRSREKSNARIVIENKNIEYKQVEQEVRADLLKIYYAYENNLRLLRLEAQNLAVARENLDIALERYKLGSLAGLELREVQKSLLDAEERLISVKYQTKLAEISLHLISGKIMDYM